MHTQIKIMSIKSHSRCEREQSCPIHPIEQEHLLGAVHLPFTQDGEQIAATKKRQGVHENVILSYNLYTN